MLRTFPDAWVTLGMPLGPGIGPDVPRGSASDRLRASRPWRPEVDAVAVRGDVLYVVEAKVREYLAGMGKLPFYRALIPQTPELRAYWGLEVRMRLVVPQAAPWVMWAAEQAGVEVDVFFPVWIAEYHAWRDGYWTAEWARRRSEVIGARQLLGLR
jgi:hypothetical protein